LLCGLDGNITHVLHSDEGIEGGAGEGRSFLSLIGASDLPRGQSFLDTLRRERAAFNCELSVRGEKGRFHTLNFGGGIADDTLLIVGARSRSEAPRFYNDLMRINNEQTNALRAALKALSVRADDEALIEDRLYDDLSRLNNELANMQRELAKKNHELARLNEQKNQFLGIAAHDLRNPLEVIRTHSQFLLDDASGILDEEQVDFVNIIRSSSGFMLNLVNDFLDYSKIEAGKLELDPQPTDLARLVENAVKLNRAIAARKDIRIDLRCEEYSRQIIIDQGKIEQVLNNLIGNAIKFSRAGTTIEVQVSSDENEAVVSIQDEGIGIAADEMERLLDPFHSGKRKSTAGERSTGLGLAIVKKIVEGHGGQISVDSEPSRGSRFWVTLPSDGRKRFKK